MAGMDEHWFIYVVLNFAARTSPIVLCHGTLPLCCLFTKTNLAQPFVRKQQGCDQTIFTILFGMATNVSLTTQSLSAALKDLNRLEASETKKKEKDTPAQAVAKAVTVSISTDARMQILKDTLK